MEHWVKFWTALWVGSTRLTRLTVDWLCNARPKRAPAPPAAKTGTGKTDEPPQDAGEQQPDKPAKKTEKAPTADPEGSALLRWFGILAACVAAKTLPYTTILAVALATAWVLTALILGYIAALPAKPTADEHQDEEESAADEEHPRDLLDLGHVAQLLADVYTEGSGVHLATLAEHLSHTPLLGLPPARWETRDVRDLMARHGVRVRDGVRVPPKGGREGVHKENFPPLPQPSSETPVVGVVVPGQSNNNNMGNVPAFTITDDPDHPVRHTVHHAERT
ncbi:hypothetical protein ACN6LM_003893 [Streptomyces sp. SAS_281]|uniref:hypothetical protein n=1 Tax=Streptomyces sp. SAS_281 TaxID=3412744 RepID=UPI00403C5CD5